MALHGAAAGLLPALGGLAGAVGAGMNIWTRRVEDTTVRDGETLSAVFCDETTSDSVSAQHPALRQNGDVWNDGQGVVVLDVAGHVLDKAVLSGES